MSLECDGPAASVYGPDQHADRLHGVETPAVVGPEDAVLEFAAVHSSGVPDTVEVGLATGIVPPASFMEMGTVTCYGIKGIRRKKKLMGKRVCLIKCFTKT